MAQLGNDDNIKNITRQYYCHCISVYKYFKHLVDSTMAHSVQKLS